MISALIVTKADRAPRLLEALCDFAHQTYPDRELIVVAEDVGTARGLVQDVGITSPFKVLQMPAGMLLGSVRNLSLEAATGDLVMCWDDDDRYHPARMAEQLKTLELSGADVCCLARVTLVCACGLKRASSMRLWENSMLARRAKLLEIGGYPNLPIHEDSEMFTALVRSSARVIGMDAPELYEYRYHGGNVCARKHWALSFSRARAHGHPSEACEKKRES